MRSLSSAPFRFRRTALAVLAIACGLIGVTGRAAAIGYWRFEPGAFRNDSSGNGRTLTGRVPAGQIDLRSFGPGSAFSDPIPQTGASNVAAAYFYPVAEYHTLPDEAIFTDTSFTIEAYISVSNPFPGAPFKVIASHWDGTIGQRSWQFTVLNDTQLGFRYSADGTTTTDVTSSGLPVLTMDNDYYVAVVVNMADPTATGITFYQQDLTHGGTLQSVGKPHVGTTLHNSTSPFTIGDTGSLSSRYYGLIDELRYSDTPLNASKLLISAPEPSTLALCLVGGVFGLFRRSRR